MKKILYGLAIVAILLVQGCSSSPTRLPAVPPESTAKAEIPGMPEVRYAAGVDAPGLIRLGQQSFLREAEYLAQQGHKGPLPPVVFVAISGGGDNGAFTAGLMNAWTATGTRPEFKLVTGISTGALIAPFAFLGPKYDATLKEVYTTISPKDVIEHRSIISGVLSDAMADNAPLLQLTRKSVTEDLLKEIAAEYAKGRMLLVATADLDARRAIIWDMGKIASYGGPKALDLFVNVMIASASIPGGFPPMMIDVEVDGKPYQEMHVDGGIVAQVFAYPVVINLKEQSAAKNVVRERKLYVIRNARLDPDWAWSTRIRRSAPRGWATGARRSKRISTCAGCSSTAPGSTPRIRAASWGRTIPGSAKPWSACAPRSTMSASSPPRASRSSTCATSRWRT